MSEPAQEARRSPKRWLGAAIKIAIAVALLAYVFNQPKFHARQLVDATRSPWFALSLAVGVVAVTLTGVRWGVLLSGEGVRLPILRVLKLTWIGHFWNMIIPGSVTGDVVKMFYVGKEAPDRREEAWTTVFADRVIGLTALITVSVVAALSRLDLLAARPGLQAAVVTMGAALVAVTLAWVGVISGLLLRWSLLLRLLDRIGQRDLFDRVHDTLARIARHPRQLAIAFGISLVCHGLWVTNAFVLGRALGEGALSFPQYAVVVPIALFVNAVPITPGGLGVGETALKTLFEWAGGQPVDGSNVMLMVRIMMYSLAAAGGLLYVLHRRAPVEAGAQPGSEASAGEASTPEPQLLE